MGWHHETSAGLWGADVPPWFLLKHQKSKRKWRVSRQFLVLNHQIPFCRNLKSCAKRRNQIYYKERRQIKESQICSKFKTWGIQQINFVVLSGKSFYSTVFKKIFLFNHKRGERAGWHLQQSKTNPFFQVPNMTWKLFFYSFWHGRSGYLPCWSPWLDNFSSTGTRTGAKNNPGTAVQNLKHPVTCQSNWQKPGKNGAVGTFFRSAQTCPSTPSVEDDFHFSGDRQRGILFSARPCDASAKMVKQEIVRRRNCFTQLIRVPKDVRKKWMTVLGDKWWNYFCKIGSLVLKMEDKSWNI